MVDKPGADGRCPSCKSYLAENGECDVCGWMPGDPVPEKITSAPKSEEKEHEEKEEETNAQLEEKEVEEAAPEDMPELPDGKEEEEAIGGVSEKEERGGSVELDPKEAGIQKLMKLHKISREKAERLYKSKHGENAGGEEGKGKKKGLRKRNGDHNISDDELLVAPE